MATGHCGGGDVVDVDGALLVEPEGQPGEVLLAENRQRDADMCGLSGSV